MAVIINFKDNRPEGYYTYTDKQLSKICKEVEQFLLQQNFFILTLLDARKIRALSQIITEFGEDTYFEIGLWDTLEKTNQHLFGNPLPFSKPESLEHSDFPFDEYKLVHLLWNTLLIFHEQNYFSPHHVDLLPLAEKLSYFLEKKFDKIKGESSVKKFLTTQNKLGFQVKRKLVWLGKHSYLFRHLCDYYLYLNDAEDLTFEEKIPYWDDFFCQECTLWSGMGVLDFLVEIIGLSAIQKLEVSNWYERHVAYYEILEVNKNGIKAENIIINEIYNIHDPMNNPSDSPFKKGMIIFGGTVKFDGRWYWSGNQRELTVPRKNLKEIAANFYAKNPIIVYRYNKVLAEKVKERMLESGKHFQDFFNSNYVEYQTGKEAAAASFEKMLYEQKQKLSPEDYEKQLLRFEKTGINAGSSYSPDFLESEGGICLFHNPGLGDELTLHYFDLKEAFQKEGKGLSLEEINTIQHPFQDNSISLEFIQLLIKEFGTKSITAAFYLKKMPKYSVDYLLRKMKGKDFRTRYPLMTILDSD